MAISIAPHNPNWTLAFQAEAQNITSALPANTMALHHIGSTAVPNIYAKPIIDLLGVVTHHDEIDAQSKVMEDLGYEVMGAFGIKGRRYFRKISSDGIRTHHLHVFANGSPHIARHLAFRDYLRAHPDIATTYSDLKRHLTQNPDASWEAYMDGKDPFIKATEEIALTWYKARQTS